MAKAPHFPDSAAALRAKLADWAQKLRAADARGDRRAALEALEQMLALQTRFLNDWRSGKDAAKVAEEPNATNKQR